MEYWKKVDKDGNTTTVESHSFHHEVPDAIQISKEEYDEYIASLPVVEPKPARDYGAEIDKIKDDYDALKAKVDGMEKK